MPLGKFVPFDPADYSPRFFARPLSFDCECPYCGRLIMVGRFRRDNDMFDRMTSMVQCKPNRDRPGPGCGRKFLIGLIAWTVKPGRVGTRAPDQMPNERQIAELRQEGAGVWPRLGRKRGQSLNTIQPRKDEETDG
jgi:hypothetical protein